MPTLLQTDTQTGPAGVDETADPRVYFDPPLWLQRRTWILNQLRKERIESVIDLGCGEGALLEVLMEPASCYPGLPIDDTGPDQEPSMDIHLKHYVGLDVDAPSLVSAVEAGGPPKEPEYERSRWLRPSPRWIDFNVDIWQGGLEFLNGDGTQNGWFGRKNWDAIASAEVVEHLPSDVLEHFLPVTLGVYRPAFLFLTTPNYNFNQLFSHPDRENRASGYPDPTGETNRVFRHHDHRREWTEEEWGDWCRQGASAWGYEVEVGGVGRAEEEDAWGRTKAAGKASLTASFRKLHPRDTPTNRRVQEKCRQALLEARRRSSNDQHKHKLLLQHLHSAHPTAGRPGSRDVILDALRDVMRAEGELGYNGGTTTVDEVWLRGDVAAACGGCISALLDAVDTQASASGWILDRNLDEKTYIWRERFWSWKIIWKAFVRREPPDSAGEESESEGFVSHWTSSPYDSETSSLQSDTAPAETSDTDTGGWAHTSWGNSEQDSSPWGNVSWGDVSPSW